MHEMAGIVSYLSREGSGRTVISISGSSSYVCCKHRVLAIQTLISFIVLCALPEVHIRSFRCQTARPAEPSISTSIHKMRLFASCLLLATLSIQCLAKPRPLSMEDIQRRWSQGESEVCCSPHAPGCYVLAWFRSLGRRRQAGVRLPVCSFFFTTAYMSNQSLMYHLRHQSTQNTVSAKLHQHGPSHDHTTMSISLTPLMSGRCKCTITIIITSALTRKLTRL